MKQYTVSVPVNCMNLDEIGREGILLKLKQLDAKRVFLNFEESTSTGEIYCSDEGYRTLQMEKLAAAAKFFKDNGYEVAAWFWTFKIDPKLPFMRLHDLSGEAIEPFVCPSDKNFVDFASECVENVARCGVDMIVFNDDFRYGFFYANESTCLCDNHLKRIHDITGESISRNELRDYILQGSKNRYRDAFLQANKAFMLEFASAVRDKVDTVNPDIRIGFCASMSAWDLDGDAYELASVLAGDTRPFIRLIGAPYWVVNKAWGNRLQDVIELTRMEVSYFDDKEVELVAEGDVWPRPRTMCPAAYLEGFDTALRATQKLDGILKMGLDSSALHNYEEGYVKFHIRNKNLYSTIEDAFSGKENTGIRVFEFGKKLSNMKNPNEVGEKYNPQMLFFSEAARTLACNGIPTTYGDSYNVGIAFGENARYLTREDIKRGLIVDIAAAAILNERGIDTGIKAIGTECAVLSETFLNNNNRVIAYDATAYKITVNDKAELLSVGNTADCKIPMSFIYTNDADERFLVLNINPRKKEHLMRHYARGYQYYSFAVDSVPAVCIGNPDMYMICAEDDSGLAIGLWNFSADIALNPVIQLNQEYSGVSFLNGNGKLSSENIVLDDVAPYSSVVILLKK